MKTVGSGCVFIHLWIIVGVEMRLVHVRPVTQCLRFIKQKHEYAQLYKSDEKNVSAYFCFVQTHSFSHESTQSFMHLAPDVTTKLNVEETRCYVCPNVRASSSLPIT